MASSLVDASAGHTHSIEESLSAQLALLQAVDAHSAYDSVNHEPAYRLLAFIMKL